MPILGVDISHFQGSPNFAQVKASGRDFVVLKATEGTTYVDITCNGGYDIVRKVQVPSNRAAAHAAGLIVGLYHFARAGNPATEAAWFVHSIGTLQPGEFLVLDWEVPAADPVGWCRAWLAAVTAATGVKPLIYMNSTAMNGSDWTPLTSDFGLWLAKYDNATAPPAVKWWQGAAIKQFSDHGTVPGIAGACDVDVFYGSAPQLLAYGKSGSAPAPAPTPEDDMTPDQQKTLDNTAWLVSQMKPVVDAIQSALGGYGARVEGIQNELQGQTPGTLNEDLRNDLAAKQAQLDAIVAAVGKAAPQVDPVALAAALVADQGAVDKLADALAAALASRLQS